MMRKCLILASAALLALGSQTALAYTWWVKCGTINGKWESNNYSAKASAVGFPTGSWRDALASVVRHWHGNPSNLAYTISYDDPGVGLGNGESEVWWSSGFGAPAITNLWLNQSTCRFTEADIRFDNTVAYTTSTIKNSLWSYGGSNRPFQTTAMHEFGHAGGLGHTANTYSIMGQDWTHIHANGENATAYHGEDAASGVTYAYGIWSGGYQDLGVSQWRWTGSSGEYSTHQRTRIFDCSGVELPKVAGTSEPVYKVNKGQCVQLELTYENMGTTTVTTAVGYYLSTNDFISTLDTPLSTSPFTLSRDTVLTFNKSLTVPSDLISGQNYWLGAIIDYTASIAEREESNNATYVSIRVN